MATHANKACTDLADTGGIALRVTVVRIAVRAGGALRNVAVRRTVDTRAIARLLRITRRSRHTAHSARGRNLIGRANGRRSRACFCHIAVTRGGVADGASSRKVRDAGTSAIARVLRVTDANRRTTAAHQTISYAPDRKQTLHTPARSRGFKLARRGAAVAIDKVAVVCTTRAQRVSSGSRTSVRISPHSPHCSPGSMSPSPQTQTPAPGWHTPPEQVSEAEHASPSSHALPSVFTSGGQVADAPSQLSAGSHCKRH